MKKQAALFFGAIIVLIHPQYDSVISRGEPLKDLNLLLCVLGFLLLYISCISFSKGKAVFWNMTLLLGGIINSISLPFAWSNPEVLAVPTILRVAGMLTQIFVLIALRWYVKASCWKASVKRLRTWNCVCGIYAGTVVAIIVKHIWSIDYFMFKINVTPPWILYRFWNACFFLRIASCGVISWLLFEVILNQTIHDELKSGA